MSNELTIDWPDNICADRHETTGKWVLHYLTDDQAKACSEALKTCEYSAEIEK